jgi:hypothetical protein
LARSGAPALASGPPRHRRRARSCRS